MENIGSNDFFPKKLIGSEIPDGFFSFKIKNIGEKNSNRPSLK